MDTKKCTVCKTEKPTGEFYVKSGKPAASCKECHKAARRAFYSRAFKVPVAPAGHPCAECGGPVPAKRIGGTARKFCRRECAVAANKRSFPERARRYTLAAYGLTPGQYEEMVAGQGSRCAVCGTAEPRSRSGIWHVDHCHDTGRVRGLLCASCNMGLGQFGDDPARLRAAADYIDRNR